MLRINQIINILADIKAYTPYTHKSTAHKLINKIHYRFVLTGVIFITILALSVILYKLTDFFKTDTFVYVIFGLYFLVTLIWLIIIILPAILEIKFLVDWKKESINDFVCEISHDEENAKLLLYYSEKELLYAIHWLQLKINRITTRISDFFGEKTAVLSILGLCYSAIQTSIGFDKLSQSFSEDTFNFGSANVFIVSGLAFLLGISLGALILKKVANHQLYLKEIVELAIIMLKDIENKG